MKKHLILSLTMATAFAFNAQAMTTDNDRLTGDDVYGQTFFSVRPEFQSAFPEKTVGFRDRAKARCDGNGGAFQFVAFGGRSTKSKDLMKYFAPSAKTTLIVDSNPNGIPANPAIGSQSDIARDINPAHFGIFYTADGSAGGTATRFRSEIEFRPERSVGGLGITYRQYVGRECDVADRKWWLELSAPILYVSNKMNLTERIDTTATTGQRVTTGGIESPVDMTQAFKGEVEFINSGSRMQFGLINDERSSNANTVNVESRRSPKKAMRAVGSDIELKLGYDYYTSECSHFDGYVGLHIPASRKPNGQYIFEAIPGFNQHFGFMTGMSTGVELWRDCDRSINWEVETNHRYFIQNTQTRSFDLKNRPWSRYMIVVDADGDIQPGINVFTRAMKVQPRYSFDLNTGLVYGNDCGFSAELGYNFFARQGERVSLKDPFPTNLALVGFDADGNFDTEVINRLSNIGDNNTGANYPAQGEANFVAQSVIRPEDLGLNSAAAPAALTNAIYGALGYNWDDRCYPLFVGLGGSYEFSGKNTALNRWVVWGKFGVSI